MTFRNYLYDLKTGQTYGYIQKQEVNSGSTEITSSTGSTGSTCSASSADNEIKYEETLVKLGSADDIEKNSQVGTVEQLSLSTIMSLYESGNLTADELVKGLKAHGASNVVRKLKGEMVTFTFRLNGKKYFISCTKVASKSQTDNKDVVTFKADVLKNNYKLTQEELEEYFYAVEMEDNEPTKYIIKPDCPYKTLADLSKAIFSKYKNQILLESFVEGGNRTTDTISGLLQMPDGNTLTEKNYFDYKDSITLKTGAEKDALSQQALEKFAKDFEDGYLAKAQVSSILKAIGCTNVQVTTQSGMVLVTFNYGEDSYSYKCEENAAKKGTDEVVSSKVEAEKIAEIEAKLEAELRAEAERVEAERQAELEAEQNKTYEEKLRDALENKINEIKTQLAFSGWINTAINEVAAAVKDYGERLVNTYKNRPNQIENFLNEVQAFYETEAKKFSEPVEEFEYEPEVQPADDAAYVPVFIDLFDDEGNPLDPTNNANLTIETIIASWKAQHTERGNGRSLIDALLRMCFYDPEAVDNYYNEGTRGYGYGYAPSSYHLPEDLYGVFQDEWGIYTDPTDLYVRSWNFAYSLDELRWDMANRNERGVNIWQYPDTLSDFAGQFTHRFYQMLVKEYSGNWNNSAITEPLTGWDRAITRFLIEGCGFPTNEYGAIDAKDMDLQTIVEKVFAWEGEPYESPILGTMKSLNEELEVFRSANSETMEYSQERWLYYYYQYREGTISVDGVIVPKAGNNTTADMCETLQIELMTAQLHAGQEGLDNNFMSYPEYALGYEPSSEPWWCFKIDNQNNLSVDDSSVDNIYKRIMWMLEAGYTPNEDGVLTLPSYGCTDTFFKTIGITFDEQTVKNLKSSDRTVRDAAAEKIKAEIRTKYDAFLRSMPGAPSEGGVPIRCVYDYYSKNGITAQTTYNLYIKGRCSTSIWAAKYSDFEKAVEHAKKAHEMELIHDELNNGKYACCDYGFTVDDISFLGNGVKLSKSSIEWFMGLSKNEQYSSFSYNNAQCDAFVKAIKTAASSGGLQAFLNKLGDEFYPEELIIELSKAKALTQIEYPAYLVSAIANSDSGNFKYDMNYYFKKLANGNYVLRPGTDLKTLTTTSEYGTYVDMKKNGLDPRVYFAADIEEMSNAWEYEELYSILNALSETEIGTKYIEDNVTVNMYSYKDVDGNYIKGYSYAEVDLVTLLGKSELTKNLTDQQLKDLKELLFREPAPGEEEIDKFSEDLIYYGYISKEDFNELRYLITISRVSEHDVLRAQHSLPRMPWAKGNLKFVLIQLAMERYNSDQPRKTYDYIQANKAEYMEKYNTNDIGLFFFSDEDLRNYPGAQALEKAAVYREIEALLKEKHLPHTMESRMSLIKKPDGELYQKYYNIAKDNLGYSDSDAAYWTTILLTNVVKSGSFYSNIKLDMTANLSYLHLPADMIMEGTNYDGTNALYPNCSLGYCSGDWGTNDSLTVFEDMKILGACGIEYLAVFHFRPNDYHNHSDYEYYEGMRAAILKYGKGNSGPFVVVNVAGDKIFYRCTNDPNGEILSANIDEIAPYMNMSTYATLEDKDTIEAKLQANPMLKAAQEMGLTNMVGTRGLFVKATKNWNNDTWWIEGYYAWDPVNEKMIKIAGGQYEYYKNEMETSNNGVVRAYADGYHFTDVENVYTKNGKKYTYDTQLRQFVEIVENEEVQVVTNQDKKSDKIREMGLTQAINNGDFLRHGITKEQTENVYYKTTSSWAYGSITTFYTWNAQAGKMEEIAVKYGNNSISYFLDGTRAMAALTGDYQYTQQENVFVKDGKIYFWGGSNMGMMEMKSFEQAIEISQNLKPTDVKGVFIEKYNSNSWSDGDICKYYVWNPVAMEMQELPGLYYQRSKGTFDSTGKSLANFGEEVWDYGRNWYVRNKGENAKGYSGYSDIKAWRDGFEFTNIKGIYIKNGRYYTYAPGDDKFIPYIMSHEQMSLIVPKPY